MFAVRHIGLDVGVTQREFFMKKIICNLIYAGLVTSSLALPFNLANAQQAACNWYGTQYPLCTNTSGGWGYENNTSCISRSTCSGQPSPFGIVGGYGATSSSPSNANCPATTITPHLRVGANAWQQTGMATINNGTRVTFGPHPTTQGSWTWSGCGTSGTAREQVVAPINSCQARATFTNACGTQSTYTYQLTIAGSQTSSRAVSSASRSSVSSTVTDNNGAITLWIAGDSTVANGGSSCPYGWGRDFAGNFNSNVNVQNLAVAGRSVRTWLYDVQATVGSDGECALARDSSGKPILQSRWQTMLSGMKRGDYLFIQFGINDGATTCPRRVGSTAFMDEYQMMAEAARARGATPVFVTPVSALRCSGSTAVASRGFLSETNNLGARLNVPVIDLHQRSIRLYNQRSFCPVAGGDVSASTGGAVGAFFCDDHTHFDLGGAKEIGNLVVQGIRDLNIPLAQHLKANTSETVNVFLAGDSIVQSYTDTSSPTDQAGWGQMLQQQYRSNVIIHNHAAGGRSARRFIDEGRLNTIWREAKRGDYLLVQFGTNDAHRTATYTINGQTIPYYLEPQTDFKRYLAQYVSGARSRGINLAFVTPTPRNSAYCTGANGTAAWAQAMREVAAAEAIPLIDLNQKTVRHLTGICPAPRPENFFFGRSDGTVDGTHFQENGARILARFVADGIGETGMALNAYRK